MVLSECFAFVRILDKQTNRLCKQCFAGPCWCAKDVIIITWYTTLQLEPSSGALEPCTPEEGSSWNAVEMCGVSDVGLDIGYEGAPCGQARCKICLLTTAAFTSRSTGHTYQVKRSATCKTSNHVYLIQCKKWGIQSVGETAQALNQRVSRHWSDITN